MKAIYYNHGLKIDEFTRPNVPAGEALIKVELAGICNTDIELCRGYMNFTGVLGHEFVGAVEELGPGASEEECSAWLGKRVVGEINCGCMTCEWCKKHDSRHCVPRTVLGIDRRDGVFAPYTVLPVRNLYEVPANVSNEAAVFTEPLAAAWEIIEQLHIDPSCRAAILGDGKLGLMAAMVLNLCGCKLTLVGKHKEKLAIAEKLGINTVMLNDYVPSFSEDIVVEATGSPDGLLSAMNSVRPRGTIVLKSTVAADSKLNLAPIVVNEITVLGSRCGPFAPALRSLGRGFIDPRPLISAVFPLERGLEAFEAAKSKNSIKVLIKP